MRKGFVLLGVSCLVAACTEVRYVEVPSPAEMADSRRLQACADHAFRAQKAVFGSDFSALRLSAAGVAVAAPRLPVGKQRVGEVYDGVGEWYGVREYRKVRFHCMFSDSGQVLYSFVRGE